MDLFGDLPEPSQTGDVTGRPLQEMDDRSDKRKHEVCRDGDSVEVEKKKFCKGWVRLRAHVAARRGEREEMQDAHVVLTDLSTSLSSLPQEVSRLAYFAVFDGHGGSRASRFAAEHLHHTLALKFPKGEIQNLDKLVRKCLVDAFRQTDEDFLKMASSQKPVWKDGTTATCMLVVNDDVYVANLGDSRVSLGTCGYYGNTNIMGNWMPALVTPLPRDCKALYGRYVQLNAKARLICPPCRTYTSDNAGAELPKSAGTQSTQLPVY